MAKHRLDTGEDEPKEPSKEDSKGKATAILVWFLIRLAVAVALEGVKRYLAI